MTFNELSEFGRPLALLARRCWRCRRGVRNRPRVSVCSTRKGPEQHTWPGAGATRRASESKSCRQTQFCYVSFNLGSVFEQRRHTETTWPWWGRLVHFAEPSGRSLPGRSPYLSYTPIWQSSRFLGRHLLAGSRILADELANLPSFNRIEFIPHGELLNQVPCPHCKETPQMGKTMQHMLSSMV